MISKDIFTEQARAVVNRSFRFAAELMHGFVGTEHILWSLADPSAGISSKALLGVGLDQTMIQEIILKFDGIGNPTKTQIQGLAPDVNRIFEFSKAQAEKLGQKQIGTEHLLLGILQENQCLAARIITITGVSPERLLQIITTLLDDYAPKSQKAAKAESQTKTLDQYSRDLTEMAALGTLDPVIGRDKEIQRIVQILSRRTKNNPVLIGESGVGKTAVAEGLAQRIAQGDVPENLVDKRIVALDLAKMISGTKYRGDFEERIKLTLEDITKAQNIIVFIDEMHTLIGAGASEGAMDAANIIKPALGRGELQIVGATTLNEYRKHIEKDAALERRFQSVTVEEPSQEDAKQILYGLRERYEKHHKLTITDEAIDAAVELSSRYINDRYLPDKAIDLVDEAASRVRVQGLTPPQFLKDIEGQIDELNIQKQRAVSDQDYEAAASIRNQQEALRDKLQQRRAGWEDGRNKIVTAQDVAHVVNAWTGIPVTILTEEESARLMKMEEILHNSVVGQNEAVKAVSRAVRRGRVGLKDPKRPVGSFLFLGPTGVGKTQLCKSLSEVLFGSEDAMIRVDMSEYMEKHTVSKLIGSPPGYVGYDDAGQLTEKVRRRPYSVILFDEIEKAHPDVFNILLQIMEDGILTDAQGRKVNFKHSVVVMTSNVGAQNITEKRKSLGFNNAAGGEKDIRPQEEIRKSVMEDLKKTFKPEFLNRIDEIIVFHQLDREDIRKIAANMLGEVTKRMELLNIHFAADSSAVDILIDKGFDPSYGARPLRRTIQTNIEDVAAEKVLDKTFKEGDTVVATAKDGKIEINKRAAKKSRKKAEELALTATES